MNNHNWRPLSARKRVQLLIALTLLAWATHTLLAQWARGEEVEQTSAFVPRDAVAPGGTLELRGEARVVGAEVKLRQVCRWSETDDSTFAPLADLVVTKLQPRRPYQVIDVREIRQLLEDAGINVAFVRFSGPLECTVSRSDSELKEGEALQQWIKAHDGEKPEAPAKAGEPVLASARETSPQTSRDIPETDAPLVRTLRDLLVSDLAVRLSLPEDKLVLTFDPRDEAALNLPEAQFKFHIQGKRVRDLGEVSWDVTIASPTDSRKLQVKATARAWQQQLVLNRPVTRRQVMQESDLTARRTLVDRLPDAPLLSSEQVVGQMAARDLSAETVITAQSVQAVPLAKPGQLISITLERGTVRVKSVAKAMEGGVYGQVIRVKNETTRDMFQVVLTGPQEATMAPAAAPTVSAAVSMKK